MRHLPYEIFEKKAPVLFKGMMLLSSTSFSVYLIHILVLEIFKNHIPWFSLDCKTIHPLFGIPVTAISVLIVCVGIVVGLRKVPGGKVALP
jgi:peptidoglycan/LPS O-acetylase OafA/YrhL